MLEQKISSQSRRRIPPGPVPLPVVGNLLELRQGIFHLARLGRAKYGDLFQVSVGTHAWNIVSHPALAQQVLIDLADHFPKARDDISLILGNGLVTNTDHASWLTQRRMVQPPFHRHALADMGETMVRAGQRLLDRWDALPDGSSLDLEGEMMEVTLDIITQTMFSADVMGVAGQVGRALGESVHFVQKRLEAALKAPMSWPLPSHRHFKRAIKLLDQVVLGLIRDRRTSEERPGDLLDMLLDARDQDSGQGMSDAQLRDEVLTIFAAGHETTAHAMSFVWSALARHPEVLQRLQAELEAILKGRAPGMDDLARLPYTRQIFEETLRHYPAVPILLLRQAREDTQVGDFVIPRNAFALVSVYNIHHHPDFWPTPNRFDPDRFGPARVETHRLAYMPFGAGARKCVGNALAMLEGQLLLALIAQRYELHLPDSEEPQLGHAITLRPQHGLRATLRRRER